MENKLNLSREQKVAIILALNFICAAGEVLNQKEFTHLQLLSDFLDIDLYDPEFNNPSFNNQEYLAALLQTLNQHQKEWFINATRILMAIDEKLSKPKLERTAIICNSMNITSEEYYKILEKIDAFMKTNFKED